MSIPGSQLVKGLNFDLPIFLAPMAGFTDAPFRNLVKEFGAGAVFTEMVSVMGLKYGNFKTKDLLRFTDIEHPIFAQLFGNNAESFEYAAKIVADMGFDGIDINAGCSANDVIEEGSGAALLLNLNLLARIIDAVKKSVNMTVSLKVRKGFYAGQNLLQEIIKIAENEGVDMLTIHGITAEEGFNRAKEDWTAIAEAVSISKVPVVANGGIRYEEDVKKMFEKTKAPFVMVGRASIGRPWFIKSAKNVLEGKAKIALSNSEKMYIIVRHIEKEIEFAGVGAGIANMKKFLPAYASGLKRASEFRRLVNCVKTKEEVLSLLEAFFNE